MIVSRKTLKDLTGCDYYDGRILHSRFAYKFFRNRVSPYGNIVAFRSPTIVTAEHMIDLEDVLSTDFIHSDDMMNFVFELPNTNHFGGVSFQRLFCNYAGIALEWYIRSQLPFGTFKEKHHRVKVTGDDILVSHGDLKASVSIVAMRDNAVVGHLGINVNAGEKAPDFAYSTKFDGRTVNTYMRDMCVTFNETVKSIFTATTKTIQ